METIKVQDGVATAYRSGEAVGEWEASAWDYEAAGMPVPAVCGGGAHYWGEGWSVHQIRTLAIGRRIGRAIARDVLAEGMPRDWTGLDPQDVERVPDDMDVDEVARHAKAAYLEALEAADGSA